MFRTPPAPHKPWQRRSSPLARYALLAYGLLLIDASLYPWSGWRDRGIGAFDYLGAPWPAYVTSFDIVVNVLGYLPLGMLFVLALYPLVRGVAAALLASLVCALLSAGLEALQTFLPMRVASKLDLYTNAAGACIGAIVAALGAGAILDRGRLRALRMRWFERDASVGMVIALLWFGALLYPDPYGFGPGSVFRPLVGQLIDAIGWRGGWRLDPDQFVFAEAALASASLTGAGALFLATLRPLAPRAVFVLVFIAASVLAEILSAGLSYAQANPLIWLTPGVRVGLVNATLLLLILSATPTVWRQRVGMLALFVALLLVNGLPDNPYFAASPRTWSYGQFINFFGLAQGLNLVWPLIALLHLILSGRGAGRRGQRNL